MTLTEGLQVSYKEMTGYIKFVSSSYVTMCVGKKEREVCILIYQNQWDNVKLIHGNRSDEK
jgi:hypothetical protein